MIFRSVSPRYAKPIDIVSGYGSYRAGGRWNAPGIYAFYEKFRDGAIAVVWKGTGSIESPPTVGQWNLEPFVHRGR